MQFITIGKRTIRLGNIKTTKKIKKVGKTHKNQNKKLISELMSHIGGYIC